MSASGAAASGACLSIDRSADAPAGVCVFATALSFLPFGSNTSLVTEAILVKKVAGGVAAGIAMVNSKVALAPAASAAALHAMAPGSPTAGVLHTKAGPPV